MKYPNIFFALFLSTFVSAGVHAAPSKCSKANLTRCLDSVCAINSSINPAARCQYCGTSGAGEPPTKSGLTNVTAGKSNKYALTDKELKQATSDPGNRYIWATQECLKKLSDCSTDDVTDTYDKLIEQSCKAAGISAKTTVANANLNKKKNKSQCDTAINNCLIKKCGNGFEKCEAQADFDRSFSECATDATGCDEHIADLRTSFNNERENASEKREQALTNLVKSIQTSRENRIKTARDSCAKKTSFDACAKNIESMCRAALQSRCTDAVLKTMADGFCGFQTHACDYLK